MSVFIEIVQFLWFVPIPLIIFFVSYLLFFLFVNFLLRKHLPEKWSSLRKNIGKPLKVINLTLVRFGNENKTFGSSFNQNIPIKLYVYNGFLVLAGYRRGLVINNFGHNFISFMKTESYDIFLGVRIPRCREDLIIFSPICLLQFLINRKDIEYLKNFIKEMQND